MILTHRPVPHDETQGFGVGPTRGKPHPIYGDYQPVGHLATDFGCPIGTPIAAAAPGAVVYAGWGQNMPQWIAEKYGYIFGPGGWASGIITILDHGDRTATAYSHQSEVMVTAGQRVGGGQTIGFSGMTGRSTGPHLHFEYITLPINYGSQYYSRLDPMAQYGGNVQTVGAVTHTESTPTSEEDFMAGTIDAQQAEDIAQRAAALVFEKLDNKLRINAIQAESIVSATTARTVEGVKAQADGKVINRQQADDIAQAAARYSKEK